MNNLCVVIRSVQERTEQACLEIVRSQVGADVAVHLVTNKPFAEAHIESMRLAIKSGAKWALLLDADVLIRKNAIPKMVREAETLSEPFYMLNFRVLDRGYGGLTYAGVHLYATDYLGTALQFADLAHGAQRPEAQLCVEMARHARIPTLSSAQVAGLHGYEQFYADVYRTTFVRAVKFRAGCEQLLKRYRSQYETVNGDCQDDKVAFWGLVDGMIFGFDQEIAPLDKNFYLERACQVLSILDLQEKGPFLLEREGIEQTIVGHVPDEYYFAIQRWICPSELIAVPVPDHSKQSHRKRLRRVSSGVMRRLKKATRVMVHG